MVVPGKFTPVNQFLVFDAEEVLPKIENEAGEVDEEEFAMQSTRYDGQARLPNCGRTGRTFPTKLDMMRVRCLQLTLACGDGY